VREQECWLQRHGFQATALASRRHRFDGGVLIEEPARFLPEQSRQHVQQSEDGMRLPFSIMLR
jgi:hypothetical protein